MSQIETFGKYLLLERLAAGGMAEVYLAKSSGANGVAKFLAIKRILPQYSDNPEFIDMFKEEAKIAINLSHGNVVSIYEFGVEARQFYLVMEYLEGQNLRQILNHLKKEMKEFSIDQVVYIIKQVAAGLDHAHRCLDGATGKPLNITHRDMSPQNIMISFEGEVKVVDFGIAKAESQLEQTRAGTIKGKFGYMSPEQAEGHAVDSRTDIFSLGIILWELLAKDRLFTANSEAATLRKIRECQIPLLRRINPSIPAELERICNKALAKDLGLRYQSAADLNRDLNRFLNTQYPEFSPQDFSFFMKSSFSEMFLENRKKQVEYAKIKASFLEDKTQVTSTQTATDAQIGERTSGDPELPPESSRRLDLNLDLDLGNKSQINLNSLKTLEKTERGTRPGFGINQNTRGSGSAKNFPPTESVIRTQVVAKSSGGLSSWAGPVIGVALVVLAGTWFIKTRNASEFAKRHATHPIETTIESEVAEGPAFPPPQPLGSPDVTTTSGTLPPPTVQTEVTPLPPPTTEPAPAVGRTELSSTQPTSTYTVVIETLPKSARVYLDGKDTGTFTPVRKQVPANKEVRIGLSSDGYKYYEKIEKISRDGMVLRANLEPLPKMGYISISAMNGGLDPVVYINDQRLAQKLPIRYYGVPANTPIKVRITNPFAQVSGEAIVKVGESEKRDVKIILETDTRK